MAHAFLGNFINGRFCAVKSGVGFASINPATEDEPVLAALADAEAVDAAVQAAADAAKAWRRAPLATRVEALRRVQARVPAHRERMAEAISAEMGKPIAEARVEAGSVASKIEDVIGQLDHELPPAAPGAPGEQRFHALGVIGIIGPFNFPVHLINTHLIPALLTGNTVVAKPSEVTPLAGQRYAELFADADLPPGVFNLVHGLGETGARLVAHPGVQGIVFTGSYATGRRIRQATFDQPHKKVCLELGGRNPAVVLDDADLEKAVAEIRLGAFLTTGQRCTATSRVIATPGIASALQAELVRLCEETLPGDPRADGTFMGPLATHAARDRFQRDVAEAAAAAGVTVRVKSRSLPGGAYVTPSLFAVEGRPPHLDRELFGPHLDFEVAADAADAIARAADNAYGLSASIFTRDADAIDDFCDAVRAGVININRSTNGASGRLPFGGTGMSGNWMPAGSGAPRLCTFPVAVMGR
ncbi:MAG: aldehyde dehydrogenase family protein [Myxococcales bacterium]|nr:aldehyde dehydrogenase family protein [Myxococcales bacterium]